MLKVKIWLSTRMTNPNVYRENNAPSSKTPQPTRLTPQQLELLASSRVHPVFHVSCLKKVIGDKILVQNILPELDEEGKIIFELEDITDTRIHQLMNRSISEYLIKWRKLPAGDSTWEDDSFIQKHPELLKSCGQHLYEGEGNVKP
jgi:hypothetical protein